MKHAPPPRPERPHASTLASSDPSKRPIAVKAARAPQGRAAQEIPAKSMPKSKPPASRPPARPPPRHARVCLYLFYFFT